MNKYQKKYNGIKVLDLEEVIERSRISIYTGFDSEVIINERVDDSNEWYILIKGLLVYLGAGVCNDNDDEIIVCE